MTHYFWPPALNPGDTIGLVQPSGIISPERYADAQTKIQSLGYKIYKLPEAPRNWGYLGGTDEARIAELHHMYAQPEVRAIWCVRGGYGTQRILPMLDLDLIRRNPKALIGFSDITALGNYISQQTGQISFHGIMGVSQFSPYEKQSFQQAVGSNHNELIIRPLAQHTLETEAAYQPYTITAGSAQGRLVGGNLALMASVVGTPFDIDYRNKIVLIEDIDEAPYRIDRMLTQLLNANKLQQAAGIALGIFTQCDIATPNPNNQQFTLRQVLTERLSGLGIPVYYGLPFGHITHNSTLPIGAMAQLDTHTESLRIPRQTPPV